MISLPPALHYPAFRLFWGGAVASAIGSQFTTVAMAWQMYELTNSALSVGLLGLGRAVPQMALALVGGLLADSVDRKRLMMSVQLVQFVVSAVLASRTFLNQVSPETLLVAAVLFAVSNTMETPSRQAVIPNLVQSMHVTSAVALNSTQRSLATIVGPSLAGVLLAVVGPGWCYAVDAVSWFAMLGALALIRQPLQLAAGGRISVETLVGGVRFVAGQHVILAFMVLDFGATFFGSTAALLPIYARDILGVGPAGLGILYAAPAVGAVAAAAIMSSTARIQRAGRWVPVGVLAYGACIVGFAVSPVFWISVLMLAGTGIGNTVSGILRGTSNQLLTPDHLRGRVAAVNSIFVMGDLNWGSSVPAWWRACGERRSRPSREGWGPFVWPPPSGSSRRSGGSA